MNITIVNGTNRIGNKSMDISRCVFKIADVLDHEVNIITLDNFDSLFRGKYINLKSATLSQKKDIRNLIIADLIIFVIPTYHNGIPSSLKNFLDILKCTECYEGKVIGIISCNNGNKDLGARQAAQTLHGILAYNKSHSIVVPVIPVIDFGNIDKRRLEEFITYCSRFILTDSGRRHQLSP